MATLTKITNRQKELLSIIYNHIQSSGYPPTFDEMKLELNVSSNQGVIDLLTALERNKYISRKEGSARGILIRPKGYNAIGKDPLVKIAGITAAGPTIQAIEQDEWMRLPSGYQKYENVFVVKVCGNSMINAGVYDGDAVLIKEQKDYKSGDIVLARIGDEVTLKTFTHEGGKTYLKPENPACRSIPITHDTYFLGKMITNLGKGK